jgi:hypothetical protein
MVAVIALLFAELPWIARIAGMMLLAIMVQRHWGSGGQPRLRCGAKPGKLEIESAQGWQEIEITGQTVLAPIFILLRYRAATKRQSLTMLVAGDSLLAQDFRRFALWVRWRPRQRAASGCLPINPEPL